MDTYFFNYNDAYNEAKKQNTFGIFNNLQICYYNGEINEQTPYQNLIPLPIDKICDYMMETPNRMIQNIKFDDSFNEAQQQQIASYIDQLQQIAAYKKTELGNQYRELIKNQVPDFNEPWRILFLTTRGTTVLQYAAKNLADAFNDLGYNTFISIEENAMQNWGGNDSPNNAYFAWHLKNIYEYNPHIIFNLDWINNTFLNDSVFNFVWFQDPMPVLFDSSEKFKKRDRDYFFYILESVGKMIENNKGITQEKIMLQHLCTNEKIFNTSYDVERENKIVFLGGDYKFERLDDPIEQKIIKLLLEMINEGTLSTQKLKDISLEFNYDYEYLNQYLLGSVARREIVKWVCMQTKYKVEIYGAPEWLETKEIAPFYKGLLPYGSEMARIYNSSQYALVAHHKYFYQQRLFEISACGAIPIIYDSGIAEDIFLHQDNVLTFRTFRELEDCFGKLPKLSPKQIHEDISYIHFAQKLIEIVTQEQNKR